MIQILLSYDQFVDKTLAIDLPAELLSGTPVANKAIGRYEELGGHTLGLFADRFGLVMWWNDAWFPLAPHLHISHVTEGLSRRLTICQRPIEIEIDYQARPPVTTPYYAEDEEDVDFGLWLKNVLASPERRRTFLANWRNGS
ncbi:hypothetical protein [Blastopirellula marina]|uniref:Uncharacterized protein n=1 Tax=Blastopirellula marina TaxID=124 RepID=A0A2S8G8Z6_9BACT|nr:hypothetical protein [Blastopirellula marina]PQO40936.1 hypothetical protein C5Y98_04980 [Blastopirellula marina]PTL45818.1 hypothetical protein C5Y97_04980 [Blastopirellula marina]